MARKRSEKTGPVYLTTFEVAKLLGVSPPTVVNWVNSGQLTAHRTVGGHRRMRPEDIVRFAREHDYPIPPRLIDIAPAPSQRRILIVDDEPDFCTMVTNYLVGKGRWEVEVARSGFEAGLAVARFKPVVVLMDIMMPDMDGFEALRHLQTAPETRGIPVIACTAHRDAEIEERVKREPFSGYMPKPLNLQALLQVLENVALAKPSAVV